MIATLLITGSVSVIASGTAKEAKPCMNQEYATKAKEAAKALHDLNWGSSSMNQYEVIAQENDSSDEAGSSGTYKIQKFTSEQRTSESDDGIDFVVFILNNTVLKIEAICRRCS